MNEEASAGKENIQSPSLLSANKRRMRRASEILGFSSRLDLWKDHRLMIPKECPLARTPNLLITTQPPRGEGSFRIDANLILFSLQFMWQTMCHRKSLIEFLWVL